MKTFLPIFSFLILFILFHTSDGGTFVVDYPNHQFLKDGKPFRYISGDFMYTRVHPDYWEDRIKRIRGLGLNTIQIYAPWNVHEPMPGSFEFSNENNITAFLDIVKKYGLYVLLRPGPYICAEWEHGGLPWWLLNFDGIKMRTSDTNFTNAVLNYYNVLLDVIKPYMYQQGGPILMIQLENEYAALNACDHNYVGFLRDTIWSKLGNDVALYTTDNPGVWNLQCSTVNGSFPTVDFGPSESLGFIDHHFDVQQNVSNGGPNVCSEFYITWFTYWGQKTKALTNISTIISNFEHFYHAKNASWNIYTSHGGTNFGFNPVGGIITSYDYGAPVAENGDITPVYNAIRTWIQGLTDWEYPPLDVPTNNPSKAYGQVTLKRVGGSLSSTLSTILEPCSTTADSLTFEQLNHGYGFVMYTTTLKQAGKELVTPNVRDYGYVFLNNVFQGIVKDNAPHNVYVSAQPGDTLRIIVENQGRADHWRGSYPTLERKGLFSNVTLDGMLLQDWFQCGVNLTKASIDSLSASFYNNAFEDLDTDLQVANLSNPGVYIGQFNADTSEDTFVDTTGWGKGQLFVNGYNMGRYWPVEGPQMSLYIAKPFVQTKNTVVLIELIGTSQNYVTFTNKPVYVYNGTTFEHSYVR